LLVGRRRGGVGRGGGVEDRDGIVGECGRREDAGKQEGRDEREQDDTQRPTAERALQPPSCFAVRQSPNPPILACPQSPRIGGRILPPSADTVRSTSAARV